MNAPVIDPTRVRWYSLPKGDDRVATALMSVNEQITVANADRRQYLAAMRALYLDVDHDQYADWHYHRKKRCRYPLLQGAVDGTHAQMTVSRPRPKIYTVAADFNMRQRAKLRQRWIDGVYRRLDAYERLSEIVLDGLIFGTGCLKVGEEDDQTVIDRVWCGDLWVDPLEERHNRVRTLYQTHGIDRCVLQSMFPKHAEQIAELDAAPPTDDVFPDLQIQGYISDDMISVLEAWRLPVSRNVPGRHVIICDGCVLLDEPWTHPKFPFVFYTWGPNPLRWWGQGMIERGAGMQSDLNELTEIIQEHYETMVPQLWGDIAAKIKSQQLNDEVGKMNWCRPQGGNVAGAVMCLSPEVAPGLLQREQRLAERFYHVLGVDKLAASAEKPPGLYSAAAIEQWNSSTSGRFLPQGRRLETASMELAELLFFFADRIAARGTKQRETVFGSSIGLELLEYDQVKAQDDEIYQVGIKPGSALPKDIAGRIQAVISIRDGAGVPLDPLDVAEMLELPDIEGVQDRLFAGRELVRQAMERCSYPAPEPQPVASTFWPRTFALTEIATQINLLTYQGADEVTLRRLRNLHGQVRGMPDPNAPPPAPVLDPTMLDPNAGAAAGDMPGAMPANVAGAMPATA